ncbi:MAG: bifunctional phosphoribosylaminoimidazolecarboxamide formyltransferase/IMP cyclohydrolase [Brevinematia bacterium]
MVNEKYALVSVYDKEGIVEFCRNLSDLGYKIISTSGTYKLLRESGIEVIEVSSITGFPEILDGRVKTLHPVIHGGILYRDKEDHKSQIATYGIPNIEIVVVNLYPFEGTVRKTSNLEEIVENIDIGGPTLVRSAAKNFERVLVVTDKSDYSAVIERLRNGENTLEFRINLATKAFNHIARYDAVIASFFSNYSSEKFPEETAIPLRKILSLRYGENPHQSASAYALFTLDKVLSVFSGEVLWGKELSYNNILDSDVALEMVKAFSSENFCCIIKHNTPSGAGIGRTLYEAYEKAFKCDPISAFGGIVGFSQKVTKELAERFVETFYEVVIAPDYEDEALGILKGKKNLRIIRVKNLDYQHGRFEMRSINGGVLLQEKDSLVEEIRRCRVVTTRKPSEDEWLDLQFAWKVVMFVKSNAIVIAKNLSTIGICGGQTSRIDSVRIAIEKAKRMGFSLEKAVCASEAFFPFKDSVELLAKEGITAIIQPGGSVRDDESIEEANRNGIAMVFTGVRHFRH